MPFTTHERYVNFYTDFAFKKLFGTEVNKGLLISFLNSLLEGKEVVKDLTYLNSEHLGHVAADRKAVFDVYCENEQGEKFLIEMQKAEQDYFKDRSIYYSTFPIQEQAPQGKWNFRLNKVYTIGILNFTFDDSNECVHHEVKLMDTQSREVFYDKLCYIYLEMPKFNKKEDELETTFDKWLYAIKNISTLAERPQALQDAVFERFFEQAEIAKFTPDEMKTYRESQKDYWDLYSITETAVRKGMAKGLAQGIEKGLAQGIEKGMAQGIEKGLAQGIEKGRAEGVAEAKAEMALQMKNAGMDASTIAKITGLTADEIDQL